MARALPWALTSLRVSSKLTSIESLATAMKQQLRCSLKLLGTGVFVLLHDTISQIKAIGPFAQVTCFARQLWMKASSVDLQLAQYAGTDQGITARGQAWDMALLELRETE